MLHGGVLTFHLSFDSLLPALVAERPVIGVELQGHGHTADTDRPFSIRQCAEDVVALVDQLGDEQADFFGYSLGGLTATEIAARHPERVGRVVLAASHFRPDGYYPEISDPESDSPRLPTEADFLAMKKAYEDVAPDPERVLPVRGQDPARRARLRAVDRRGACQDHDAGLDHHRRHRLHPARARRSR